MNLDKFLKHINEVLPPVCTDRDLVEKIPTIFKNPVSLFRLRQKKEAPAHFYLPNSRVVYLKEDIIEWIKGHYSSAKKPMDGIQGEIMAEEALCGLK